MHACTVPATALLCPAIAILLLAQLSSHTTAAAALNNTSDDPCAPAECGGIIITFPFWLAGTHQPECGHKAFQLTCDRQGNLFLKNSYRTYNLLDISYGNTSFRLDLSGGPCDFQKFVNASFDLGLSPFKFSPKNQELFFLYGCDDLRESEIPRSWTSVRCLSPDDPSPTFAVLGGKYRPGGGGMSPPVKCDVSVIPVLGYQGATGADYRRLLKGGFLLEYTDDGLCADCMGTGGRCRVDVSDDEFECRCSDGSDDGVICGEYVC